MDFCFVKKFKAVEKKSKKNNNLLNSLVTGETTTKLIIEPTIELQPNLSLNSTIEFNL